MRLAQCKSAELIASNSNVINSEMLDKIAREVDCKKLREKSTGNNPINYKPLTTEKARI